MGAWEVEQRCDEQWLTSCSILATQQHGSEIQTLHTCSEKMTLTASLEADARQRDLA
jgi:aerobic-type carbon monoxide dehydrogenase small subunit (CoxS/CutS family)